jgi:hypothetical protein
MLRHFIAMEYGATDMLREFLTRDYEALIVHACLLVASIIAVRRRFGVASVLMVASSGIAFIVKIGYPLLLVAFPPGVLSSETLDRFHFWTVLPSSNILFGLSLVWFMIQQRKASGTQKHLTNQSS